MTEDRVHILGATTNEHVDSCYGPGTAGTCPFAACNPVVACAGRRVSPVRSTG